MSHQCRCSSIFPTNISCKFLSSINKQSAFVIIDRNIGFYNTNIKQRIVIANDVQLNPVMVPYTYIVHIRTSFYIFHPFFFSSFLTPSLRSFLYIYFCLRLAPISIHWLCLLSNFNNVEWSTQNKDKKNIISYQHKSIISVDIFKANWNVCKYFEITRLELMEILFFYWKKKTTKNYHWQFASKHAVKSNGKKYNFFHLFFNTFSTVENVLDYNILGKIQKWGHIAANIAIIS